MERKCDCDVYELSQAEAEHTGLPYSPSAITKDFDKSKFSQYADLIQNDITIHHNIVTAFCKSRLLGCSWIDYYKVLDHIRVPFVKLFDPGQDRLGTLLKTLQDKAKSGNRYQSACDVIERPTATTFYKYVDGSKPVIIRGLVPSLNPDTWSFASLTQLVGDVKVLSMLLYVYMFSVYAVAPLVAN